MTAADRATYDALLARYSAAELEAARHRKPGRGRPSNEDRLVNELAIWLLIERECLERSMKPKQVAKDMAGQRLEIVRADGSVSHLRWSQSKLEKAHRMGRHVMQMVFLDDTSVRILPAPMREDIRAALKEVGVGPCKFIERT
jgi:hypothetical protein